MRPSLGDYEMSVGGREDQTWRMSWGIFLKMDWVGGVSIAAGLRIHVETAFVAVAGGRILGHNRILHIGTRILSYFH